MTVEPDDRSLLGRSAAGDRGAFTAFMDRHVGAVHRFLRSLRAEEADVEDALQECFVSAWRSAGTFQGDGSVRAWLFTIARNALRRQHRRRAGEPARLEPLEALGEGAGWGADPAPAGRFEAADEVEWGLGHLPDEEREVVVMRDLEGMSGVEVAEALGLGLPAMKSRLHRGRLRLMGVLRTSEAERG